MTTDVVVTPPLPITVLLGGLGLILNSWTENSIELFHNDPDNHYSRLRYFKAGQEPYESNAITNVYGENLTKSIANYTDGQVVTVKRLELDPLELHETSTIEVLMKSEDHS